MLISLDTKHNFIHVILENKRYSSPAINHMRWNISGLHMHPSLNSSAFNRRGKIPRPLVGD